MEIMRRTKYCCLIVMILVVKKAGRNLGRRFFQLRYHRCMVIANDSCSRTGNNDSSHRLFFTVKYRNTDRIDVDVMLLLIEGNAVFDYLLKLAFNRGIFFWRKCF